MRGFSPPLTERNVERNIHRIVDNLRIGISAADLLLGEAAIPVRDEKTALGRSEGKAVPPRKVVGIPVPSQWPGRCSRQKVLALACGYSAARTQWGTQFTWEAGSDEMQHLQ